MTGNDRRERGDKIILVTGATGKQGGAAVRHLLRDGWRVRALTRDVRGPAARALAAAGAEVTGGDLDDRASLDAAADDAHGVFSVQTGALGVPPVPFEVEVRRGIAVAEAAGRAAHLVYTSVAGAQDAAGVPAFEAKLRIEEHIRRAGLPATVLRPVSFMENYLGADAIATPFAPGVPEQLIAVDDIGAFAALAFADPAAHLGETHSIAGDALTPPDIAAAFTRASGRDVPYVPVPLDALPADTAAAVAHLNARGGYGADVAATRALRPQTMDLAAWLAAIAVAAG
ncbi:NmrA family NAD(P)-binding protein [Actinomadura opuntiae]|uniref:NmrA family NAD(P)-binding protein n=1 Tax=Actinomadura sp. OS1-43 TaxID=604315 RepID=UPI00255B3954|nr:NmrA family NAD(P)-binding protein [Actinomadura sp. OS1-43]MDL4817280.1 NmrA family NAD(P)-binding protein [Actinomadura sp. OS1-43]